MQILKKAGCYEAIWASQFNQSMHDELLKASRRGGVPTPLPSIHAMESLVFLCGMFSASPTSNCRKMYAETFTNNSMIMNKKLLYSLRLLFQRWEGLFEGDKRPKFTNWVKDFVEYHPEYRVKKSIILLPQRRRTCVWPRILKPTALVPTPQLMT